jgi:hypothetical protein
MACQEQLLLEANCVVLIPGTVSGAPAQRAFRVKEAAGTTTSSGLHTHAPSGKTPMILLQLSRCSGHVSLLRKMITQFLIAQYKAYIL